MTRKELLALVARLLEHIRLLQAPPLSMCQELELGKDIDIATRALNQERRPERE